MLDVLSLTGKRWQMPGPATGSNVAGWLNGLLERRGVVGEEAIAHYLEPSLQRLPDPATMADMAKAVSRLQQAISLSEAIVVYGDYDVDGVCSTSVLVDFLRGVGARVDFYIPDRRSEGYGLNAEAIAVLAKKNAVIVTADCGITAHAEIALAKSLGADVIIVDHHRVPETLPEAYAALNPQRGDCAYPFKFLCATGVAFMLVMALRRGLRESGFFLTRAEPDMRDLLDLVAIATIADMVPLQDANRILVAAGLPRVGKSKRVGLRALVAVSDIKTAAISTTDIGFRIAPRINARGRMSHAGEAVELLLTSDQTRAASLAQALDAANYERRNVEKQVQEEAIARVLAEGAQSEAALVLYDPGWHPGVLGLVATRLVSRFYRPAIVIGEGGKGSGRAIAGLDLHAAIQAASCHLLRFGGHAAAAGVTIAPEKVGDFRSAFCHAVRTQLGAPPFVATVRPDLLVQAEHLSLRLVDDISRLAPFGQENPEPLFLARGLQVQDKRKVGDSHLKLRLAPGNLDAIAFGLGGLYDNLPQSLDVAFRVERNIYNGRESLQLKVEDLRAALQDSRL